MSDGIAKRLVRLETVWRRPAGCEVCEDWDGWYIVCLDRPLRPERCERCGRVVPIEGVTELAIMWELI